MAQHPAAPGLVNEVVPGTARFSLVVKVLAFEHFLTNQKSITNNQRNQFLSFVAKVLPINNQRTNSETDTATNQAAELLLGFLGVHLQRRAGPTQQLPLPRGIG